MSQETIRLAATYVLGLAMVAWPTGIGPLRAADADRLVLEEAKLATSDESLVAFLNRRSASDDDLVQLDLLIRQLGSDSFQKRIAAAQRIVGIGLPALPACARPSPTPIRNLPGKHVRACEKSSRKTGGG